MCVCVCVCERERERERKREKEREEEEEEEGGVFAVATEYGAECRNVTRGTIFLEKISPTYPLIMGCL